jgi:hypothetical protein
MAERSSWRISILSAESEINFVLLVLCSHRLRKDFEHNVNVAEICVAERLEDTLDLQ